VYGCVVFHVTGDSSSSDRPTFRRGKSVHAQKQHRARDMGLTAVPCRRSTHWGPRLVRERSILCLISLSLSLAPSPMHAPSPPSFPTGLVCSARWRLELAMASVSSRSLLRGLNGIKQDCPWRQRGVPGRIARGGRSPAVLIRSSCFN
jgi:hypothetical protein